MKNVKNQTKGVKNSNEGKRDNNVFILKYAIRMQTSYKVGYAIRDALNEIKVKYDAKPFASSMFFFGEDFTIKVFNSKYELGQVEMRMAKYTEEVRKVLEAVISASNDYYVENTQNRVYYSNLNVVSVDKPNKIATARENSNRKISYENNGEFFSINTIESVDVNVVEDKDTSIKYSKNVKLSTDICKGTLQFMPLYMYKLFTQLDKLNRLAEDYKEVVK